MINLSPSNKKFFKIDFESKEEIELTNVSEQNNVLFTSISPLVNHTDTIKVIHQDGYGGSSCSCFFFPKILLKKLIYISVSIKIL